MNNFVCEADYIWLNTDKAKLCDVQPFSVADKASVTRLTSSEGEEGNC